MDKVRLSKPIAGIMLLYHTVHYCAVGPVTTTRYMHVSVQRNSEYNMLHVKLIIYKLLYTLSFQL